MVNLVPHHGGRPGWQGVEEDDGRDKFGVCGSKGEGEGEGEGNGPATNQRAWVGGIECLASEGGVLVRDVADADKALAIMVPG